MNLMPQVQRCKVQRCRIRSCRHVLVAVIALHAGLIPYLAIVHLALAAWMVSYFRRPSSSVAEELLGVGNAGLWGLGGATVAGVGVNASSGEGMVGAQSINWGEAYSSAGVDALV